MLGPETCKIVLLFFSNPDVFLGIFLGINLYGYVVLLSRDPLICLGLCFDSNGRERRVNTEHML